MKYYRNILSSVSHHIAVPTSHPITSLETQRGVSFMPSWASTSRWRDVLTVRTSEYEFLNHTPSTSKQKNSLLGFKWLQWQERHYYLLVAFNPFPHMARVVKTYKFPHWVAYWLSQSASHLGEWGHWRGHVQQLKKPVCGAAPKDAAWWITPCWALATHVMMVWHIHSGLFTLFKSNPASCTHIKMCSISFASNSTILALQKKKAPKLDACAVRHVCLRWRRFQRRCFEKSYLPPRDLLI